MGWEKEKGLGWGAEAGCEGRMEQRKAAGDWGAALEETFGIRVTLERMVECEGAAGCSLGEEEVDTGEPRVEEEGEGSCPFGKGAGPCWPCFPCRLS